MPVHIWIPLPRYQALHCRFEEFDKLSPGLTIEEIIAAAAKCFLYNGKNNQTIIYYLNQWDMLYFSEHVDPDTLGHVQTLTMNIYSDIYSILMPHLRVPILFDTGYNMLVLLQKDTIYLHWNIDDESDVNPPY